MDGWMVENGVTAVVLQMCFNANIVCTIEYCGIVVGRINGKEI